MALALLIIFLVIAVIGRIIIQYKTTGDYGIRPVKSSSPPIAKLSSLLLFISFLSILILTTLDALDQIKADIPLDENLSFLGATFALCGIVIIAISQQQMGISWRVGVDNDEKTSLITQGIYTYIRNPIYTGLLVFCTGLLILIPDIFMLVSVVMIYISIELHVRYVEEPYLYKMHKEVFEEYMERTGRYFPKVNNKNQ